MTEQASRETVRGDIEGVLFHCSRPTYGCGYEGYLIPTEWETRDWARANCPGCFEPIWERVYG